MPAQWLDRGLVMLSNHEPLSFRVRRGKQRVDEAAHFEAEHSEEFVRKAAAFGITCLRTHYYKGGGLRYEAPEMRITAKFIKLCHKYGIRVQGYIQHGTLSYETLFLEKPAARKWVALDQYGLKSSVTYGYQFFRYKPCVNQQGFVAYLKKVVRKGIQDGLDMLGFDNAAWSVEPTACQCPVCKRKFREFLNRKYSMHTAAGRKTAWERFALPSFACVEPPNWHRWAQPLNLFDCCEPMLQEWVDFKCECIKENMAEIYTFAKKLKPGLVLEWNCYSGFGDNGALWVGIDPCRNMPYVDAVYNEQDPSANINQDGVLTGKIHSYKLFSAYGKFMLSDCNHNTSDEELVKLSMAEGLAFNSGNLGRLPGGYNLASVDANNYPGRKRYIDFSAQNRNLYLGAKSLADVAVLESFDTLAYTRIEPYHSLVAVFQTLLAGHFSFDILTLDRLAELKRYRLLILPNVKLLSDRHAEVILDYVHNGGSLLFTEKTGAFDEWFRARTATPFAGKEGCFGKGQIRHFAQIEHKRKFSYKPEDWYIDMRLWQLPANHKDFIKAVRELLNGAPVLEITAPYGCVSALFTTSQAYVLHLLNYDATRKLSGIAVRLRLNDNVASIRLLSPDKKLEQAVAFKQSGGSVLFKVPELQRYAAIVISPKK